MIADTASVRRSRLWLRIPSNSFSIGSMMKAASVLPPLYEAVIRRR
jgi:hypothetical protein